MAAQPVQVPRPRLDPRQVLLGEHARLLLCQRLQVRSVTRVHLLVLSYVGSCLPRSEDIDWLEVIIIMFGEQMGYLGGDRVPVVVSVLGG